MDLNIIVDNEQLLHLFSSVKQRKFSLARVHLYEISIGLIECFEFRAFVSAGSLEILKIDSAILEMLDVA